MTRWRSIWMTAFTSLAVTPSGASAGDFGAMSRGTVSISITIPPHVEISPDRSAASSGGRDRLCVRPDGTRPFHLGILPSGASAPVPLVANASPDQCEAGGAAVGADLLTGSSAPAGSASAGPVTLLVIPD